MRVAVAVFVLSVGMSRISQAAFTDFSDYPLSQNFQTGEVFQSNGLSFKAIEMQSNPNPLRVGQKLFPGPGVEFLLAPNIQEISLRYVDGAASAIAINGVEPTYPGQGGIPFNAGFSFLNGASLAGVSVSTLLTLDGRTQEEGLLTLRGPINSLVIAGLELSLDDILVRVPEPASAVILIIGAAFLLRARQRWHA